MMLFAQDRVFSQVATCTDQRKIVKLDGGTLSTKFEETDADYVQVRIGIYEF